MNQEMKRGLQEVFDAPAPQGKEDFFRQIKGKRMLCDEIGYGKFMCMQASYIRKWVWLLSVGVFLVALVGGCFLEREVLWLFSALMPYLALSLVAENVRSEKYGMTELEMATRFSLRSVVLARMGVVGICHLVLLGLLMLLGYRNGAAPMFQTGVYLLVPYLLTDVGSLWLVRKMRSREALYASLGFAGLVSIMPIASQYTKDFLYRAQNFGWWVLVLFVLGIVMVAEWRKRIGNMEEMEWSL